MGLGSSVAIAFNGYWERYRKLWRLITEEKPWIFWVDSTGVLWRQHWDDISSYPEKVDEEPIEEEILEVEGDI